MLVADVSKRCRDTVQERLGADEAMIGQHVGAVGKVLAGAEPNLKMQGPIIAEQASCAHFAFRGNGDLREQRLHQFLLTLAQFVAARPAVKTIERERIAGLVCSHCNVRTCRACLHIAGHGPHRPCRSSAAPGSKTQDPPARGPASRRHPWSSEIREPRFHYSWASTRR